MIIDAHNHFWTYNTQEFGWIADDVLRRDFQPGDLLTQQAALGITGTIAVEARQSLEETRTLIHFAERHTQIKGVVAWVDLCGKPDWAQEVAHPKVVAVRHVVQDEPDDNFILRKDFNRGVSLVGELNLAYEILVFQRQLKNVLAFADRHPTMRLILDHMGKPQPGPNAFAVWRQLMTELAQRPNVFCKVSGLVTEVGRCDFRPYFDVVLNAFTPQRVVWGSDWPVLTANLSYADWFNTCRQTLPACCFGETSAAFYKLKKD